MADRERDRAAAISLALELTATGRVRGVLWRRIAPADVRAGKATRALLRCARSR